MKTYLPFIIDLFDEEETVVEEAHEEHDDSNDGSTVKKSSTVQKRTFPNAKDPDLELRLRELESKYTETRTEAANRRRENRDLKNEVNNNQKALDAFKKRTVRSEAKAVLAEAGALHPDVLDIFLKNAGERVKVDDNFDVSGITEYLNDFKESHKVFFKQPERVETPEEKAEREEREKPNRTSNGSSVTGTSTNTTSTNIVDKNLSAKDMLEAFKRKAA